ncbi:response regulator [Bacillus shivajii]|uniref:response regulator transcription factor n=1 Tax=Bacillus shivajii TaxID=1983719 RepID=UPI001CFC4326|nr:response regulator [Bacillus shivajii]UCZ52884.1 response regulator [Bacillus shivajii]
MNKMLIVDDDWMITDSLKHMEEWLDLHIDVVGSAANGKEALFWLKKEKIDIILTDIRMPEMDGIALTKHIYDEQIKTNVIIMSGFEEFTYAQEAMRYNARGYLLKPIDTTELLETVQKVKEEYLAPPQEPLSNDIDDIKQSQTQQERVITSTINYINSNYMEPLTLKQLAERVHLSDHYLGQLFKSVTGESFLKYLTNVRMKKAATLLENPVLKIYEISERVGYTDPKHFMKVFKKSHGCTPKDYRQRFKIKTREVM